MTVSIMKFDDGFIPPHPIEVDTLVDNMQRFTQYILPNVHIPDNSKHGMNWKKSTLAQIKSDIDAGVETSQLFICINDPDNPLGLKVVEFAYTIKNASALIILIEKAP